MMYQNTYKTSSFLRLVILSGTYLISFCTICLCFNKIYKNINKKIKNI